MTTYQPGDIVDVVFTRAEVHNVRETTLMLHLDGVYIALPKVNTAAIRVERLAPAEWPPQPGDLWRDKHGELWFVYTNPVDEDGALHGRTTGGKRWTDAAHLLITDNAPLTLVHREG